MSYHPFAMRQWTILVALAAALLGTTRSNVAGEVDLPRQAISPESTLVVWADLRAITWEKIDQSFSSLIDAAPAEKKQRARELLDETREKSRATFTALEKGVEAGLEMFATEVQPSSTNATAEPDDEAEETADPDADPAEAPQSETGQLFLRMRPGTRPNDAMATMVATYMAQADVEPDSEEAQAMQEAKEMEFVDIGDGWFAAQGEDMLPLPPKDQARDPKPFIEAMEKHGDAAIRFVWLMDDAARFKLDQARLEPGAIFFGGLITPLRDMQSTTFGIWLGKQPKIVLNMEFAAEEDSRQFKTALDQLVIVIGLITALRSDDAENPEAQQNARAALTLLFLDRNGANLSKTFDVGLLQRLGAAGLSWTNLLEPDEADEVEEPQDEPQDEPQ